MTKQSGLLAWTELHLAIQIHNSHLPSCWCELTPIKCVNHITSYLGENSYSFNISGNQCNSISCFPFLLAPIKLFKVANFCYLMTVLHWHVRSIHSVICLTEMKLNRHDWWVFLHEHECFPVRECIFHSRMTESHCIVGPCAWGVCVGHVEGKGPRPGS